MRLKEDTDPDLIRALTGYFMMKTKEISDQNYVLLFFQISVVKFFNVYRKLSRGASIFSLIMGASLVSRIRIPKADTDPGEPSVDQDPKQWK